MCQGVSNVERDHRRPCCVEQCKLATDGDKHHAVAMVNFSCRSIYQLLKISEFHIAS